MKRTIIVMSAVVCLAEAALSHAAPSDTFAARANVSVSLAAEKRELALTLATRDAVLRPAFTPRVSEGRLAVDLKQWLSAVPDQASLRTRVERADRDVRRRKGIEREASSLLQLRLAHPSMLAALKQGVEPLYAYEPDGNDSQWQFIEAFDRSGGVHHLDVQRMPERPVLVVDIDARKDLAAGLKVMRERLAVLSGRPAPSLSITEAATSTPVTILDRIRLSNDEEPWISGNAEVYAVVAGIDPSREQPALDIVDMPYLDTDGRDYYPNQILVFWDRYRWAATNVILMEHDDNTNYQALVTELFNIASQILTALGRSDIGALVSLGSGLVQAMPSHWFSNDDDYVDSFYTLEKGRYYTNYPGARGNALVSLRPYAIAANSSGM